MMEGRSRYYEHRGQQRLHSPSRREYDRYGYIPPSEKLTPANLAKHDKLQHKMEPRYEYEYTRGLNKKEQLLNGDPSEKNLHAWGEWRTHINDNIINDVLKNRNNAGGPAVNRLEKTPNGYLHRRSERKVHGDPSYVLNYSLCTNNATDLTPEEFLSYGIPRAKVSPINQSNTMNRDKSPPTKRSPNHSVQNQSPSRGNRSPTRVPARDEGVRKPQQYPRPSQPYRDDRYAPRTGKPNNSGYQGQNRPPPQSGPQRGVANGYGMDVPDRGGSNSLNNDPLIDPNIEFTPRTDYTHERGDKTPPPEDTENSRDPNELPASLQKVFGNYNGSNKPVKVFPAPPPAPPPPPLPDEN